MRTKVLLWSILLWTSPAIAQWQVPDNSIPFGKGPGKVGFGSVTNSGTGALCLTNTTPPSFATCPTPALDPVSVVVPNDLCDGVTDIKSLIDAAQTTAAAASRSIRLPSGTCISSALSYSGTVAPMAGQGKGLTTLKLKSGSATGQLLSVTGASYFTLSDLTLDGNNIVSTQEMVICTNCIYPIMQRVRLQNGLATVGVAWGGTTTNWRFLDSEIIRPNTSSTVNNQAMNIASTVAGGMIRNSVFNSTIAAAGDLNIDDSEIYNFGYGGGIATGPGAVIRIGSVYIHDGTGIDLDQTAVLGIENLADDANILGARIERVAGAGISNFGSGVNRTGNTIIDCGKLPTGRLGTSTTAVLIGTGAKSFTTQLGLSYAAGQSLFIWSAASVVNAMSGTVTSYNSGTGALVMNISGASGAGTPADWNIEPLGNNPYGIIDAYSSPTLNASYSSAVNNDVQDSGSGTCKNTYAQYQGTSLTNIQVLWNSIPNGGTAIAPANSRNPVNDLSNTIRNVAYFVAKKIITFSRTFAAATASVAYTGVGFRPVGLEVSCNTSVGDIWWSRGFSDAGKNAYTLFAYAIGNVTQANTIVKLPDDNNAAAANRQEATVSSYDVDGFTLAWTKVGAPVSGNSLNCFALATQ